jgi:hypothetical protein
LTGNWNMGPQSSLKGRGLSTGLAGPFFELDVIAGRADEGSLSRLGRSPTAERPEGMSHC